MNEAQTSINDFGALGSQSGEIQVATALPLNHATDRCRRADDAEEMIGQPGTMAVARVPDRLSPVQSLQTLTWLQLCALLSTHKVGEKEGSAILPAHIEPGPRKAERVQVVTVLMLDIEGCAEEARDEDGSKIGKRLVGRCAPELQDLALEVNLRGWAGVLATSYSHKAPSADGGNLGPRYRVTLPISRPLSCQELRPLALHVALLLGVSDVVDTSCMEPARLYYLPRCPVERIELAEHANLLGIPLDVDELLANAAAPAQTAPNRSMNESKSTHVIEAFNDKYDAGEILEGYGYQPRGPNRWIWPGSTSGMAGVIRLPESGRVFSHHPQDPLYSPERHSLDAFEVFSRLGHSGNCRAAVREAAQFLGLSDRVSQDSQELRDTRPLQQKTSSDPPGPSPSSSGVCLQSNTWPTLDVLPELDELENHSEPFPMDALGVIAGKAAKAVANKVQAPEAIAAGSVLGSIAVATQPLADVVLPHGAVAPLSLAIITAAASGDRKSATDTLATQPLEEFRRVQYREFAKELASWESTKGAKGDRASAPMGKSLTVSKATVEGLTKLLRHQSHVGLFSPDGADVLGGYSMQAERRASGIAWHLRAWSGESLDNLTAGEGLSAVAGRRVSMHILVQPVVLHDLMADPLAQGQGLIARCLISAPRTLAGTRLFKLSTEEDDASIAFFHNRIRQLLHLQPETHPEGDGLELALRRLHLDEAATALWIAFYNGLEVRMAPGADLAEVRPWVSKAPEQAARIAAGLTVLADPQATEVNVECMDAGLRVVSYYLGEHVRLMGLSRKVERIKQLQTLLEFMRGRGRPITQEHLLQQLPRSLRSRKAEGLAPLLEELSQRGYIRHSGAAWEVRP